MNGPRQHTEDAMAFLLSQVALPPRVLEDVIPKPWYARFQSFRSPQTSMS